MRLRTSPRPRSAQWDAPSAESSPRKGLLFCPGCDHESPVDGDWIRATSAGRTTYHCPDCGSLVVAQPAFEQPNAQR